MPFFKTAGSNDIAPHLLRESTGLAIVLRQTFLLSLSGRLLDPYCYTAANNTCAIFQDCWSHCNLGSSNVLLLLGDHWVFELSCLFFRELNHVTLEKVSNFGQISAICSTFWVFNLAWFCTDSCSTNSFGTAFCHSPWVSSKTGLNARWFYSFCLLCPFVSELRDRKPKNQKVSSRDRLW